DDPAVFLLASGVNIEPDADLLEALGAFLAELLTLDSVGCAALRAALAVLAESRVELVQRKHPIDARPTVEVVTLPILRHAPPADAPRVAVLTGAPAAS